jgi:hypothetical protein
LNGRNIEGINSESSSLLLTSTTVEYASLSRMSLATSDYAVYFKRCLFEQCRTSSDIAFKGGELKNCIVGNAWFIGPEELRLEDCYFFANGDGLMFNTFTAIANVYNPKGGMFIKNLTGGTINIYTPQGTILIDSSCTGGTINIYGIADVLTNNGSSTLSQYYLQAKESTLNTKASQSSLDGYGVTVDLNSKYIKSLL